ncbi:related to serine proteinase inhibitor IA-2 [Rhynchosporium graminicola]|uniref:Related to serine proteinase inhibitor IA-2 n=1 Tax=Rhynchosporium graminicola TaxID=2792576 RepID=A0A1E1KSQ6_9HELO|nr:related to serine proteinase inhibitor IA-2 [Rhynchosporium commune]
MKFTIFSVLALATAALAVTTPQKSIIVSWPDNTPSHIITEAMDKIKAAGGMITHEYKLIQGFAAQCPVKFLQEFRITGTEWNMAVEEDQMVSINSGS